MAANEALNALSTTDASNTPADDDVVGSTLDDELRSIKANIARAGRFEATATVTAAATLPVTLLSKSLPVDGSVGGSVTLTLPAAATAGNGFFFYVFKAGTQNDVILDGDSAETIDGLTTFTLSAQYSGLFLLSDGSGWSTFRDDRTPIDRTNRGFSLTMGTDPAHDVNFGAGACWDSTNTFFYSVDALTKQFDAIWAVGSAAGGMDVSVSAGFVMAVSDVVHLYAIRKDSDRSGDIIASLSSTWAGVTQPSGYTYGRHIGALSTNASRNIRTFVETGGEVNYGVYVTEVNAEPTTSGVLQLLTTVSLPPNARAWGSVRCAPDDAAVNVAACAVAHTRANGAAVNQHANFYWGDTGEATADFAVGGAMFNVVTDSTQRISWGGYWTGGSPSNFVVTVNVSGFALVDRFAE